MLTFFINLMITEFSLIERHNGVYCIIINLGLITHVWGSKASIAYEWWRQISSWSCRFPLRRTLQMVL